MLSAVATSSVYMLDTFSGFVRREAALPEYVRKEASAHVPGRLGAARVLANAARC